MPDDDQTLKQLPDDTLICFCNRVDKGTIVEAIELGASSVTDLQAATGAGLGNQCKDLNPKGRCCHCELKQLIEIYGKTPCNESNSTGCCCNNKEMRNEYDL